VSKLEPLVAAPHSPDNRKTARECSDVKIDRVYIGSCTGARRGWQGILRAATPQPSFLVYLGCIAEQVPRAWHQVLPAVMS
jgi:hypothetical protein